MIRLIISLALIPFFLSASWAEPMTISETCALKMLVAGKWTNASASSFSGVQVDAVPNKKNPEFLQFISEGNIYIAKKSCFSASESDSPELAESEHSKPAKRKKTGTGWSILGGLGLTFSAKQKHEISISGTSTTAEGDGKGVLTFGMEARKHFSNFFASGSLEYLSFKSSSGGDGDGVFSLLLMPGVSFGEAFRFWGGMGAGVSMISAKGASETDGSLTVSFPDKSLFALNLSPRIGFGFDVGGTILDLMVSYNMIGTANWNGTATVGTTSLEVKDAFKLSYLAAMLRVGQNF
jgi:hypothetical protein